MALSRREDRSALPSLNEYDPNDKQKFVGHSTPSESEEDEEWSLPSLPSFNISSQCAGKYNGPIWGNKARRHL